MRCQLFASALLHAIVEGGGALLEAGLAQPELRIDGQRLFDAYAVACSAGSDKGGEFGQSLLLGRSGGEQVFGRTGLRGDRSGAESPDGGPAAGFLDDVCA